MNRIEDLVYDPVSGDFHWSESAKRKAGQKAGGLCLTWGYRKIKADGKLHMAHRLAWKIYYGHWPNDEVDHINGIKSDNRISNLRIATRSENAQNQWYAHKGNPSGYLGVSWHAPSQKWRARICSNGNNTHIGYFSSKEEASTEYKKTKAMLHQGRGL